MTIAELASELNKLKLPYKNYNLKGDYTDEGFGISKVENCWQVYYCERGNKRIDGIFPTESDACEFMLCVYKRISNQNRLF